MSLSLDSPVAGRARRGARPRHPRQGDARHPLAARRRPRAPAPQRRADAAQQGLGGGHPAQRPRRAVGAALLPRPGGHRRRPGGPLRRRPLQHHPGRGGGDLRPGAPGDGGTARGPRRHRRPLPPPVRRRQRGGERRRQRRSLPLPDDARPRARLRQRLRRRAGRQPARLRPPGRGARPHGRPGAALHRVRGALPVRRRLPHGGLLRGTAASTPGTRIAAPTSTAARWTSCGAAPRGRPTAAAEPARPLQEAC